MATRARFGRLPRAAPSLTSTIVALAQQYQQQRDRNIETAWKDGGQFEGKPVTDKMFLDHWKSRLKEVSTDDPMWDYYNNLIQHYEFTIAESKMGQLYAEEKVNENQMKAFYHKWAAKLPHDSEAYRQLMTQAAKFKAAAGARGRGSTAKGEEAAYQKAQADTYRKHEQPWQVLTNILAQFAESPNFHILSADDFKEADFGFSKLASVEGDPYKFSSMLVDIQNSPDWMKFINAQMKAAGAEDWGGQLNIQTIVNLSDDARNGATISANRAQAKGRKEDTNNAKKRAGRYSVTSSIIGISLGQDGHESFVSQNEYHRGRMDAVLNDPGSTRFEQDEAMKEYRYWLDHTGSRLIESTQPPGAFDPTSPYYNPSASGIYGRLKGTIDALDGKKGGPTLLDDLYGQKDEVAGPESDAGKLIGKRKDISFELDAVADGTAIQVETDGNGRPTAGGGTFEIFKRDAPEVAGNDNLVPMVVPTNHVYGSTVKAGLVVGGEHGEIRYFNARDVKVKGFEYQDPFTGAFTGEVKPYDGQDPVVGKELEITAGGRTIKIYGTYIGGHLVWSPDDPFADGVAPSTKNADGSVTRAFSLGNKPKTAPDAPLPEGQKLPPPVQFNPHSPLILPPENTANPTTGSGVPGRDWQPITDRRMAWDSPFAALTNSSSPDMNWVATQLGESGMKAAEKEWYQDQKHWTPQMTEGWQAQIARGVDPNRAFIDTVAGKVNELPAEVAFKRTNGFLPEDQQATRSQQQAQRNQQTARGIASLEGQSPAQFAAEEARARAQSERADLVSEIDTYDAINKFMPTVGLFGATIPTGRPPVLPPGWSAGDLLNQPGMSLDAAKQLAWQITNGKYGAPPPQPGQVTTITTEGLLKYPTTTPVPGSPYLPRPGVLPRPAATVRPAPLAQPGTGMRGPIGPGGFGVAPPIPKPIQPRPINDEDLMSTPTPFVPPKIDVSKVSGNVEWRQPAPRVGQIPF